ncbi:MAG: hypothetical protein WBE26_02840, partial [Phycisphaerae bacterium]
MPFQADRRGRVCLGALILAWGIQAIVTESLLVREALVLMFGSEFAWGIVLSAWLFGVAVGAAFGGWVAERLRRVDVGLVVVLLALSAAACAELWIFRGARAWLGVAPGELLPLPKTAIAAMLFVSPTSALVGMAFPLACCITRASEPQASACAETPCQSEPQASACADAPRRSEPQASACTENPRGLKPAARAARGLFQLGNVYALESAGSLVGGAAFSFWAIEHLSPIQTVLTCGAITAAASAGLLTATTRKRFAAACLVSIAVAALLTTIFAADALDRRLVLRRWQNVAPGYELCTEAESKYQNLAVGRRAEQFTLYSDGHVSADFPDPYTFVPLAHFWLCQHTSPRKVLVLGGGAEGLLAEILRHPVEHVDYVETDPRQIELIQPYLTDADIDALKNERVSVHHVDARYFVKTQVSQFDLVIARLPEPISALRARLYTDEFYRELRRAMTPQSVLCMTAAAMPGRLSAASAEYLASIRATLRRHFAYITVGWGNPAHILAATEADLVTVDPVELAQRYSQRGIGELKWFDPVWFDGAVDWLDSDKLRQRASELDAASNVEISTDLRPIVYVQRLTLWERMTGGETGRVIERLRSIGWFELIVTLLAIAATTLAACYVGCHWQLAAGAEASRRLQPARRPRPARSSPHAHPRDLKVAARPRNSWFPNGAIILSVGTTGFATMALSIIWLFAFQNLYGYVYQRIGWIIAVFMGGLVIGCGWVSWRTKRIVEPAKLKAYLWQRLIAVDVLLALLALVVPFILPVLGSLQS